MGRVDWMAWLWPGMPQLWRHGSWLGLAAAVAFAAALNFALVNTLIWTEWFGPLWRAMAWVTAAATWLAGVAWTWRAERRTTPNNEADQPTPASPAEDLFSAATREYLQGNWLAAQAKLEQLLARNQGDVEARLLRGTLFRRTGRLAEARAELERLIKMENAAVWRFEIDRELERLDRPATEPASDTAATEPELATSTCKAA